MSGKRLDRNKPEPAPASRTAVRQVAEPSKKKKKRNGRDRGLRIAIIVVAALLAMVISVLAVWKSFVKAPDLEDPTKPEKVGEVSDIAAPVRVGGDHKENFYTFLVIGRDTGGGGNTDTVLLAAYDISKQEMNVLSIPRDTMVNVSWDVKKINSVYNVYGGGDKGIEALGKEMAQLVGFVPDFQVVLEWKAVGELVDALGGVSYDVPRNMKYDDPTQNLHINIKKGLQKLTGAQAMQVVRFRDGPNGYNNGDLGRIETQQGFLKAVIEQCLSVSNVTRINELTKVFKNNVTTNLEISDIAWFGEKAIVGGLKTENVHFYTMPCTSGGVWSRSYSQKLSYVLPKTDELVALVNERFNPYRDALHKNELDIMFVNSDGTIASSTGKLDDVKANASLGGKKPSKTTSTTTESGTSGTSGSTTKPSTSGSSTTKTNTSGGSTKTNTSGATGTTKTEEGSGGTTTTPEEKPPVVNPNPTTDSGTGTEVQEKPPVDETTPQPSGGSADPATSTGTTP